MLCSIAGRAAWNAPSLDNKQRRRLARLLEAYAGFFMLNLGLLWNKRRRRDDLLGAATSTPVLRELVMQRLQAGS